MYEPVLVVVGVGDGVAIAVGARYKIAISVVGKGSDVAKWVSLAKELTEGIVLEVRAVASALVRDTSLSTPRSSGR